MYVKKAAHCAIVFGDLRISYEELHESILRRADSLACNPGDRVIIFAENHPRWIQAFFAVWERGAIVVPVDALSSVEELAYILRDCQPTILLYSAQTAEVAEQALKGAQTACELTDLGSPLPTTSTPYTPSNFGPDDTAVVIYTSGTTGSAKGVMLSWANLMSNVRWTNDSERVNAGDRLLAVLPLHHVWPLLASVLSPFECGATVVFLPKLTGDDLRRVMVEEGITKILAVPRLFDLLLKGIKAKIQASPIGSFLFRVCRALSWRALGKLVFGAVHRGLGGKLEVFICGGAKLDLGVILDYRAIGITVVEGYGLTETSPLVTWHDFVDQHPGSVGKAYADEEIRIAEDGEIMVRGPNVMKGYWNKPEETRAVLSADGWFSTGDLGSLDKKGFLFITGRKKDLIVLPNGKNVRPDLIEDEILKRFPLVKEFAVTERNGQLFGIVRPDLDFAHREHISNISETIKWGVIDLYNQVAKSYQRIQDFMITNEELPRTRLGKIKRFMLSSLQKRASEARPAQERPQNEEYALIEAQLIFLSDRDVKPDDHFEIDLGLDSLSLVEFQTFVEKTFGIMLPAMWTATWPTVEELSTHVHKTRTQVETNAFNWATHLSGDLGPTRETGVVPRNSDWMLQMLTAAFTTLFCLRVPVITSGIQNIPRGACIVAPNHQSLLDSIALLVGLPAHIRRTMYFLAKEKNFRSTVARMFARRSNVIIMDINRNLVESMRQVARVLNSGNKVVIFPEGARSRTGHLGSFKKTFAILAHHLQVAVVPVAIRGTGAALPLGRLLPKKGRISVEFLDPIVPGKLGESEIVRLSEQRIKNVVERQESKA